MSVKKEASGRRWVEVEIEVPGTPEEVWQAIATGPGISSWFVPTEFEAGADGTPTKVVSHFAPGTSMDALATVTAWEPPQRFIAESRDLGPDAPPIATEWIIEARSGGTCVVRVVHSLFAASDDWDGQLEGWEGGWPQFFRILRLYLTHFRGQHGSTVQLMGVSTDPAQTAWTRLTGSLDLAGAAAGQRRSTAAGGPRLAGLVERADEGEHHQLLMRLDEPAPGLAHVFALPMGGQVYLVIRFYLFGERAPAVAAREEPVWQAWMNQHFPSAQP